MLRLSFASLRARLLVLVLLAIVPALGLVLYTNFELRQMIVADAKEETLRLAQLAANDQEDSIRGTRQLLFALAQLSEVRSSDTQTCSALFAQLLRQYPQYTLLGVIGLDGQIFCSAYPPSGPSNVTGQSYFQQTLQTRDFTISDYQIDRASGKATLNFGYPVLDEFGQPQAVVFASLDLGWLNQLAAGSQLPAGSTFTVIDRNGTVLVRYPDPEAWVGRSVTEAPIVELILNAQGEGTAEALGVDGVPRLYAFTPLFGALGHGDVVVTIGVPTGVAFAEANRVLVRNLLGLGLVGLLALVAAWFGSDWFVLRWVHELINATQRLSTGNLSVRTGLPYGQGELSQLARAFDDMAASLERHIAERNQAEAALRETQHSLEQRVVDRTRALSALYDVTSVAGESLDLETILQRSLNKVLAVMGVVTGAIHLFDEPKETLYLAAVRGTSDQPDTLPFKAEFIEWVYKHSRPLVSPQNILKPQTNVVAWAEDIPLYIGVPMQVRGRVLGVLSLVSLNGQRFQNEDIDLLDALADQVGIAVENGLLYQQAEQLAVMEERSRLARELHDSVTQSLYSLTLFAEVGRRAAEISNFEQVSDNLSRLGEVAQQTLKEMRLLVYELRTSALETEGLVGALQQRLDAVEKRAGVEARLIVEAITELPPIVEEGLYRIAQEALNNSLKHAAATIVTVKIMADDQQATLEIMDNGRAFDLKAVSRTGGMGLTSMHERAEKLGGKLTIFSKPGQGTKICAHVPTRRSWSRPILPVDKVSEVTL